MNSHPHIASCLRNLARLYSSQGFYSADELLYEKVLVILKAKLGTEHAHTQIVIESLASLQAQVVFGCDPELVESVSKALTVNRQAFNTNSEILP